MKLLIWILYAHMQMYRHYFLRYIQFFILIEFIKSSGAHLCSKMLYRSSYHLSAQIHTLLSFIPPDLQCQPSSLPSRLVQRVWLSLFLLPNSLFLAMAYIYLQLPVLLFFSQTPVKMLLALKEIHCKHKFDILCSNFL